MRRMLAGFLATSMIVAVASATTFAAGTAAAVTVTFDSVSVQPKTDKTYPHGDLTASSYRWNADISVESAQIVLKDSSGNVLGTISVAGNGEVVSISNDAISTTGATAADPDEITYYAGVVPANQIAGMLDGATFTDVNIGGVIYSGKLSENASNKIVVNFDQKGAIPALARAEVSVKMNYSNGATTVPSAANGTASFNGPIDFTYGTISATASAGVSNETADLDKAGDFDTANIKIQDVLVCYPDGTPIPLTENANAVDEDLNNEGGVQSGTTVYFMIRDDERAAFDRLEDDNFWKIKVSKGDNGKHVKEIKDITKIFSKDLYDANKTKTIVPGTGGTRHRYIKLSLNEIYTDDEFKLTFDLRLSAQSKAVDAGIVKDDDTEIKIKDFSFWMKNMVKDADNDWKVGIGGLMLNPLENDWNEVTYYDEDGDLAFMKFFADSDVDKFYAKLSTKWEHADYASYFNDQDAFIFNFTGSPKLSSTSRADLQIYNPFVDEDGNETVDPTTAVVYQVIDGDLYDVTDSFEYKEGENGDMAFCTRTRFLGTYIICEKAVEEAVADETVPDELTPDTTEAPEDLTPDNNAGGKQPANTGRYI